MTTAAGDGGASRDAARVTYRWRGGEPAPRPTGGRRFNRANWVGFWSVVRRESMRYLKNPGVTILPPLMSEVLFITVFGVALGTRVGDANGVPYVHFMIPGIVMMGTIINAFINPSFTLFDARRDGYIDDMMTSPLSATEMALAMALAGTLRGLLVGTPILLASLIVLPWFPHPGIVALMMLLTAIAFSFIGLLVGLMAEEYDHVGNVLTFGLNPLIFFGGVFYSLDMVTGHALLELVTRLNPVTYIVDGLRFGMIGVHQTDVAVGIAFITLLNVALATLVIRIFESGWKLQS